MIATIFLVLRILLSISLYAFILILFFLLWKENWRQGIWLSERKVPSISLTIQTSDSPTRIWNFAAEEINIGRDSTCQCRLDDENVSNHHARLKYHHTQWWLEDLGSKNGTLINNQPFSTPVVLITGDEIICGKYTLTINISTESLDKSTHKNTTKANGDEND